MIEENDVHAPGLSAHLYVLLTMCMLWHCVVILTEVDTQSLISVDLRDGCYQFQLVGRYNR